MNLGEVDYDGPQNICPQRYVAYIDDEPGCNTLETFSEFCPDGHGRMKPHTMIPLSHVAAVARTLIDPDVVDGHRPAKTEFESGVMSLLEEL